MHDRIRASTKDSWSLDIAIGLSWLGLPIYILPSFTAFAHEMSTRFDVAGFGYHFIIYGMPLYMIAWSVVFFAGMQALVSAGWVWGALGGAVLVLVGYANIGRGLGWLI